MVFINGVTLAIAPNDDVVVRFMRQDDPDYVELLWYGPMKESKGTTWTLWGMSLESAEMSFRGVAQWVCPD